MKRNTLLVGVLLLIISNCYAQWKQVYKISNVSGAFSIFFVNQDTGFVVGGQGIFFRTLNSGQTWTALNNIGNFTATSVFFFNNGIGYIVGGDGLAGTNPYGVVLKSTDFGNTWKTQSSGSNSSVFLYKPLNSVYFTSPNVGYVIGNNSGAGFGKKAILKTTDGGVTWGVVLSNEGGNVIRFAQGSSIKGYIIANQGKVIPIPSWQITYTNNYTLNDVFAPNDSTVYIVSNGGYIFKSTNSGTSWIASHPSTNDLKSIYFINQNIGYVVGNKTIIKTINGGLNWVPQTALNAINQITIPSLISLCFVNDSIGFAVDSYGEIFKCTDIPSQPTITASGKTTLCQGDSAVLTSSSENSYTWSNGKTSQSIVVKTSGNYSVTVTNANGCSATSAATTVTVNTLPNTPTVTQNGNTLMSSATAGNQWYLNGNIISGATAQSYTPTQNGSYTVTVKDANSCTATSVAVNVTNVGIAEVSINNRISISPNPTNGKFTVEIYSRFLGIQITNYDLKVMNVLGEVIYKTSNIKHQTLNIDLSALPAGIYFLQVNTGEDIVNRKLVLEK